MQHTYIALDLETTGLSATKDRILEIGAVMVENGEVTGTYETFVDNGVEIPERIRELTGITEDMVAGSPEMKPAVEGFLAFSGDDAAAIFQSILRPCPETGSEAAADRHVQSSAYRSRHAHSCLRYSAHFAS